jgi:hypothetical protein
MLAWAMILPVLKRILPISFLARLMWSRFDERKKKQEEKIKILVNTLYGGFNIGNRCLERSLLVYHYLSMNCVNCRLVIGMRKNSDSWIGHAWVLVDGEPFGETQEKLDEFTPMFEFGDRGCRIEQGGSNLKNDLEVLLKNTLLGLPTDWPDRSSNELHFLESTLEHGIQPLLYYKMQEAKLLTQWPERIQTALAQESMRQTVLDSMSQLEINRVLASLSRVGIHPLLMKGTPLSYTHYPLPGLRFRSDTDLMIRRNDLDTVEQVMRDLGYKRFNLMSGELVNHQAVFRKKDERGIEHDFDFHWKISNPHIFANSISYEELESRAIKVPALGEHARALGSMHALFLACIHRVAHHHDTDRLIWLYDIHLLAGRMSREEFEEFARLALDKKVRAICLKGLNLAKEWYNTELPEDIIDKWLAGEENGEQELSEKYLNSNFRKFDILISDLENLSGWRKLQLLKEHAFPSADYMFNRYRVNSRLLLPFLYMHRGVSGVWKWFRILKIRNN